MSLILLLLAAAVLCAISVPSIKHIQHDYHKFLALGPGGTPQTFSGYLRVKILGLFALRDRYEAIIAVADELQTRTGYLAHVPRRKHARPVVEGIAPHRQTTQRASRQVFEMLAAQVEGMAPGVNDDLAIGTSCFEKHGTAIFSTRPAIRTCRGEVVHVHASDGSMHLTLHPADVNAVLAAGWGERHPLAGVFMNRFLPEGCEYAWCSDWRGEADVAVMMLYAPQSEEEIAVVMEILRAACWYVSEGGSSKKMEKAEEVDGCGNQAEVLQQGDPANAFEVAKPRNGLETP